MAIELIDAQTLGSAQLPPRALVVFGGTFDPVHEGHMGVLRKLVPCFQRVIVGVTGQNPWKEAPGASYAQRLEMLRLALDAEGLQFSEEEESNGLILLDYPYVYAEELVRHLRTKFNFPVYWAVGEDSRDDVARWKNWDSLHVPVLVMPVLINTHAAKVRSGELPPHPALSKYIKENRLYS